MACDAAGLVDKKKARLPKLDELAGLLEDLCVPAGVVSKRWFLQWERMTEIVEQLLRHGFVMRLHRRRATRAARRTDGPLSRRRCGAGFISTDAGGVGLNLQSASVLIKPGYALESRRCWNSASPGHIAWGRSRRSRSSAAGCRRLLRTAIIGLLKGKRDLFNNVIDQDASEDVGAYQKLLETLVEDLTGRPPKGWSERRSGDRKVACKGRTSIEQKTGRPKVGTNRFVFV